MPSRRAEFPSPVGMAVLSRSRTTTPCRLSGSAVIRRNHAAVLVDLEQFAMDCHRIEAMADDQGVAVEEQRYRCRCHNARVADILLLCRLLSLPESHPCTASTPQDRPSYVVHRHHRGRIPEAIQPSVAFRTRKSSASTSRKSWIAAPSGSEPNAPARPFSKSSGRWAGWCGDPAGEATVGR